MNEIDQGYIIVEIWRARKNASEAKSNMPRAFRTKIYRNQRNKKIKVYEKLGINIINSTREALIMDRMNNNNLWVDDITRDIYALERLGVFQY